MNKTELRESVSRGLSQLGISSADIATLRSIAKVLHWWDELECGDEHGNCIERDEATNVPYMTSEPPGNRGPRLRRRIHDREAQALAKLEAIMVRYPSLVSYHQGDCRGWPLYIMRESDIPEGRRIDEVYSQGAGVPG